MRVMTRSSYLAEDAAQVPAAGHVTRMVEVLHDLVIADGYLLIFFHVAASKLGVLLAEDQRLQRLKRRLVVQTLGVAAPPPGLEEQQQCGENEASHKGMVHRRGLWGHGAGGCSFLIHCLL